MENIDINDIINQLIVNNKQKNDILELNGYNYSCEYITLDNGDKISVSDFLYSHDKTYPKLIDEWVKLTEIAYRYYKNIIINEFNLFGYNNARYKFYEIQKYLTQSDEYHEATGVILMDLGSFTKNLLR